jgi:hypothetical protein
MKIFKNSVNGKTVKAVVTRAKDNYDLAKISHPVLKEYAKQCKADFIIINEEKINLGDYSYEILQCYKLFDTYDRILIVDSDVLIRSQCPDLFAIVPNESVGVIYEDRYLRKAHRRECMRKYQEKFGDVGWENGYINSGVFLISRCHKEILNFSREHLWNEMGYDDIVIGYNIKKLGFPVYELSYKFNHMSMFSELGANWLTSYVIHYAGRGFSGKKSRFEQMQSDYAIIQKISNPFILSFFNISPRLHLLAIGIFTFFKKQ